MKNKTGSLSTYIILLVLIFVTAVFYLISATVKNSYLGKYPQPVVSSTPNPSPSAIFNATPKTSTNSGKLSTNCKIAGCSGQFCISNDSEPEFSTCEYREEYTCLKYSVCEKQASGICGFTPTDDYLSCLNNIGNQPIGF